MRNNMLSANVASQTFVVEPIVPMAYRQTCPNHPCHGVAPPVAMKLPWNYGLVGYAGSAGEGSLLRYGYFDHSVESVEVVLATGDVVRASPSENPYLFRGVSATTGTLGVATKL